MYGNAIQQIHTQTVDGLCGNVKNTVRGRLGVKDIPMHAHEILWRKQHKLDDKVFMSLLELVALPT